MADVRALLRQQRAARRINHPYATYSDAGKLLCTLCRDQIRVEAHWDAHLVSEKHKKRLAATEGDANGEHGDEEEAGANARAAEDAPQKRKLDDAAAADGEDMDIDQDEDEARRKRSRPDAPSERPAPISASTSASDMPSLSRKKSLLPSQGVQVQIPSRSSTPVHHRERSSSSSVHSQPTGGPTAAAATTITASLPSRQASNLATPASTSSLMSIQQTQPQPSATTTTQPEPQTTIQAQQVNEDEWAAFEADIAATSVPYDADAVISRPAMTAEESAAAREAAAAEEEANQNPESRKSKVDVDIEDEREEATRALEEEFEEMQELEARVRRLKEKREALIRNREGSQSQVQEQAVAAAIHVPDSQAVTKLVHGTRDDEAKENVKAAEDADDAEADDDDDDDEDDEDDWDGFRFRTGR